MSLPKCRRRRLVSAPLCLLTFAIVAGRVRADDSIKGALDRAAGWLAEQQNPDGGYGPFGPGARVTNASDVGITAFVLYAFAVHPRQYRPEDHVAVSKAVKFLLSRQQADGAFYDPKDAVLKNYRTSVAVMALVALGRGRYAEPIDRARRFLRDQQADERSGHSEDEHLSYGGAGSSGLREDLSNTAYAADALAESGLSASDPFWKKLETFVRRAQNAPTEDPLVKRAGVRTTGDWGFRYAPNDTRGPVETLDDGSRRFSSYGSMTYQGLKTLLHAQVSRDDPSVQGAFRWLSENFTVTENPGMATASNPRAGQQGLFYYYHAMAKTLSAYGEPVLTDKDGVEHHWARELSAHLLAIQHDEGYWVNTTGRWWEDLPVLDTSYAMVGLVLCDEFLKREGSKSPETEKKEPAK